MKLANGLLQKMDSINYLKIATLILACGSLLGLASAARCAPLSAGVVPVAEAGQARAVIVIPNAASESTTWAAGELQKDLRSLSGAEIPIAPEGKLPPNTESSSWILVGGPGQNGLVKDAVAKGLSGFGALKNDGYILRTFHLGKRPVVVAGGDTDAGTMYAVFDLLNQLGVTFRMTGDIIPEQQSSLSIPPLSMIKQPAIIQRGFWAEEHRASISMLSYKDWTVLFDQMAKMKFNYFTYWWFGHQPDVQFSYKGEPALIGDVSTKVSGYVNTMFENIGSRTTDEVTIGKHWFPGPRLAAPELQNVETPDQAFAVVQDMQRRMIHYAHSRHIQVWLVDEIGAVPPNLGRYARRIGPLPFEPVFGSFVDPLDPVTREIQVNRLKALAETYPEADGFYLNIPEVYFSLNAPQDLNFFAQPEQQDLYRDLLTLMAPWVTRWVDTREDMVNSSLGYFDLIKYLVAKKAEIAPNSKLGVMTVGRGYVFPLFDKKLPKDMPFSTNDTGGPCAYGTPAGMPMSYFGGMGERSRLDIPYLDDDCDIASQQFNVWVFHDRDRIFSDGVKNGLTGLTPWIAQPRGTEAITNYLSAADWNPQLTREDYYKDYSERLFGPSAAPDMYKAFMTLEAKREYLDQGQFEGYPTTMQCCGPLPVVRLAHDYSLQANPYDGPDFPQWRRFIIQAPEELGFFEHAITMDEDALASLHAAEATVAPRGKHELAYLISRTESNRDAMRAQASERRAFLAFDHAFQEKASVPHEQFVADLEASLPLFDAAREQQRAATTEFAKFIDFDSELEILYHLNMSGDVGLDLVYEWMKNIVDFNRGKLYTTHVPFEKLFTANVRLANED